MVKIFEFTTEVLNKMNLSKQQLNVYMKYYSLIEAEYNINMQSKIQRMDNCLTFFEWDKYTENKLLDLQKVNRCMNRYCPNCRKVALSIALGKFKEVFKQMMKKNYMPYLLTLTVPNCAGEDIKSTIKRINKAFKRFWYYYYRDIGKQGYKDRYIVFKGAIKVIEITYNKTKDTYNPHLHILCFSQEYPKNYMKNSIPGPYRKKTNTYIKYSLLEIQLMRIWTLCIRNMTLRQLNELSDVWFDDVENNKHSEDGLYMVNFTELKMPQGVYEIFKYSYKDTDIKNYNVFKNIYWGLNGIRLRTGLGELYNLKLDCDEDNKIKEEDDDIKNYLDINKNESPERLIIETIQDLTSEYNNYKRISRFKSMSNLSQFK